MPTTLIWLYITNLTLLILHEMDSVYWKEWELFKLKGGLTGFLLMHIPLLYLFLFGMIWLWEGKTAGLIVSLISSIFGLGALVIHSIFLKKGHPEFNAPISKIILGLMALNSFILSIMTIKAW
ncbi:hypothetical protein HQ585_06635 [candidate division KSB1 bacterium]|nr:hypothetical protein [candidate division KSB1 bacterium]